jgi:hypothetical protein
MASSRRPDASRLINGAGEGEGVSPSPILYHDVLDQLELTHADSDQWWISTASSGPNFRLSPKSGSTGDIAVGPVCANNRHSFVV